MSEIELAKSISPDHGAKSKPAAKRRLTLQALPQEIQMMILFRLSHCDLYKLRGVNRSYRSYITDDFIRSCFTPDQWNAALGRVCWSCHRPKPPNRLLISFDFGSFEESQKSFCVQCSVKNRLLKPGTKFYAGARRIQLHACRWCAWPTWTPEPFHDDCAYKYLKLIEFTRWLILARTTLTWNACALAWANFHGEPMVLGPTVTAILLMCILNIGSYSESYGIRHYILWAALEFIIMCLYIPPTYFMAKIFQAGAENTPVHVALACIVLFAIAMAVRLISTIGNIVLYVGYEPSVRYIPRVSAWRRAMNFILKLFVFWTSHHCMINLWDGERFLTEHRKETLPLRSRLALVWTLSAWKYRRFRSEGKSWC